MSSFLEVGDWVTVSIGWKKIYPGEYQILSQEVSGCFSLKAPLGPRGSGVSTYDLIHPVFHEKFLTLSKKCFSKKELL